MRHRTAFCFVPLAVLSACALPPSRVTFANAYAGRDKALEAAACGWVLSSKSSTPLVDATVRAFSNAEAKAIFGIDVDTATDVQMKELGTIVYDHAGRRGRLVGDGRYCVLLAPEEKHLFHVSAPGHRPTSAAVGGSDLEFVAMLASD